MLLETVFAGVFRRAKMGSNEAPSLPLGPENVRVEKKSSKYNTDNDRGYTGELFFFYFAVWWDLGEGNYNLMSRSVIE